jgi:hypothetical protein
MCGIVGIVGREPVAGQMVEALKRKNQKVGAFIITDSLRKNIKIRQGEPLRLAVKFGGTPTPTVEWSRGGITIPQATKTGFTIEEIGRAHV